MAQFGGSLGANAEVLVELGDKFGKANHVVVEDGDIARGLVGDVDLVLLIDETNQRAAHRDDVVVGMRREDDDAFGKDIAIGTGAVARLSRMGRLAAGPADDRSLEMPKDCQIDVVGRAAVGQKVLQSVFVVVGVGQLEDRLVDASGEPNHGLSNRGFVPLGGPQQPGRFASA